MWKNTLDVNDYIAIMNDSNDVVNWSQTDGKTLLKVSIVIVVCGYLLCVEGFVL